MAACDDAVDSALGHLGFIYIYGLNSNHPALIGGSRKKKAPGPVTA